MATQPTMGHGTIGSGCCLEDWSSTQPEQFDERQDQIVAGNLSGAVPSGPGYLAWPVSNGFTQEQHDQSGFVVDVSDNGIDNGPPPPVTRWTLSSCGSV
jgi:hypothetical protein